MNTFVEKLQSNPIFQLSLSAKELFHSNFLAWLATNKNTQGVFNQIMQDWLSDKGWEYNPSCMEVKREYKKFDFCVCDKDIHKGEPVTGSVRVVLENKFKSIAYFNQLQNYREKVKELNGKKTVQVKYILLTLAEDFLDKEKIKEEEWTIVTYAEYAQALRENVENVTDGFCREIIEHYCDFIESFASQINECLKDIKPTDSWEILRNNDFEEIRCNDIWQKVVMHKCALDLAKMLGEDAHPVVATSDNEIWGEKETENKGNVFIMVNYFHGEAFLELKYLIPQKGIFALQQQGAHPLRVGLLDMTVKHPKFSKKTQLSKWNCEAKKAIKDAGLDKIVPEKDSAGKALYKSYDRFYHNDLNSETKSIQETLEDMVKTFERIK